MPLLSVLLIIIGWLLFWLMMVQTDIETSRGQDIQTYGSDADYYYDRMITAYESGDPIKTALESKSKGYIVFGTLILLSSPSPNIIWVKFANICLLLTSLLLIYFFLRRRGINPKIVLFVILLFGLNGTIDWMVLRNLKDTLFVTLLIVAITFFDILLVNRKRIPVVYPLIGLGFAFFIGQILNTIRPFSILIVLFIFFIVLINRVFPHIENKKGFIYNATAFTLLIGIVLIVQREFILHAINAYTVYVDVFRDRPLSIVHLPIEVGRFLIGPGPIRALFGSKAFVVTTTIGNLLITLGSLMWWFILPGVLLGIVTDVKYYMRDTLPIAPFLIFVIIYTVTYAGTGDTRLRATAYLLSSIIFGIFLNNLNKKNKVQQQNTIFVYLIIMVGLAFIGSIISYKTLTH